MSKLRVTAQAGSSSSAMRRLCHESPYYASPALDVRVEFDKGDHVAALMMLERCVEDVKAQIAESHAPTWDGPRVEGEEEQ